MSEFAKKTGDYEVLSIADVHILALTYELECELNKGDWRLYTTPGSVFPFELRADADREREEDRIHRKGRRRILRLCQRLPVRVQNTEMTIRDL